VKTARGRKYYSPKFTLIKLMRLWSANCDRIRCCVLILVRKCLLRHPELIRQSTANLLGVEGAVVDDGDVRVEVREEWRLIEIFFFCASFEFESMVYSAECNILIFLNPHVNASLSFLVTLLCDGS
jgi:hypothetical protein